MASSVETALATLAALSVSASLPFYLYGAWVVLREDVVTWDVLTRHLAFIGVGLLLTTLPAAGWMLPRFLDQVRSWTALHAFLGLQAYAFLVFALTGIVRIFRAKREYDLYHDPDRAVDISEIHENMDAWRRRLRVGVFGYVFLWLLAWLLGLAWYAIRYWGAL